MGLATVFFVFSVLILMFKPGFVQSAFNTDPAFIGVMGLIVFGFILMRHVMLNGVESISMFGDELAIRVYRPQLQAAGNNSFFTRVQYNQLSSS
jgi:hypothetical protein